MPLAPSFDTFGWFADDIETYEAVGKLLLGRDPHQHPLDRPLTHRAGWTRWSSVRRKPRICRHEGAGRLCHRRPAATGIRLRLVPRRALLVLPPVAGREAWREHGDWIAAKRPRSSARASRSASASAAPSTPGRPPAEEVRAADLSRRARRTARQRRLPRAADRAGRGAAEAASTPEQFQAYRERALQLLCLSGLSGFPQITLPIGTVDGAPFGLSLLGPADSDMP